MVQIILLKVIEYADKYHYNTLHLKGDKMVIPTHYKNLDQLLNGGFKRKSLTVILGEPASGKTSLLNNIIQNTERKEKAYRRILIDCEKRVIASYSSFKGNKGRQLFQRQLVDKKGWNSELRCIFYSSFSKIIADIIYIDFHSLLNAEEKSKYTIEKLKMLAKKNNVAIVTTHLVDVNFIDKYNKNKKSIKADIQSALENGTNILYLKKEKPNYVSISRLIYSKSKIKIKKTIYLKSYSKNLFYCDVKKINNTLKG